ncbi:unnamed protein product [Calicophoron daubneyi]|uniref:VOC domain-containing protein n=1 Tax=Calicophoron daubneyi TaxID=300641 RepID=A0AAV2T9G3_CALDB
MSLVRCVHHVQFACKNLWKVYEKFAHGFGYKFHCLSKHGDNLNVVLGNGKSFVVLSEISGDSVYPSLYPYASEINSHQRFRDKPFDIAFEVSNVLEVCNRIRNLCGENHILLEPTVYSDYHGKVTLAVVRSYLGNTLHTLINSAQYEGLFLPGYLQPEFGVSHGLQERLRLMPSDPPGGLTVSRLDHISLACNVNESNKVMKWYESVLGMNRVTVNALENNDGLIIRTGDTGMHLKTMSYSSSIESGDAPPTFVFVEPLPNSSPNQVSKFLEANGGPGIQHMGLLVEDIIKEVALCRSGGVEFFRPPAAYYDELVKSPGFENSSVSIEQLQSSGVLFDPELDSTASPESPAFVKECHILHSMRRINQS